MMITTISDGPSVHQSFWSRLPLPAGARGPESPSWRPSRRACSGEGLAAGGILARQSRSVSNGPGQGQRMTYIGFSGAGRIVGTLLGVPKHPDGDKRD